jgi:hypothetical protein
VTRNLKVFAGFSVIWSLAFFVVLNWATLNSEQRWPAILGAAVVYGTGFAVVGRFLGRRDDQSSVRYSLEYAYSATSHWISAVIGSLWMLFFRPSDAWFLLLYLPVITLLAWLGYRSYQKSIKGIKSSKLFQ